MLSTLLRDSGFGAGLRGLCTRSPKSHPKAGVFPGAAMRCAPLRGASRGASAPNIEGINGEASMVWELQ